jgi:proteasome lid subunit RPN8/RPN11
MLQALYSTGRQLLEDLQRSVFPARRPFPSPLGSAPAVTFGTLQRVLLTDGVGRTLFEEYAHHRAEARGDEETGWVLLGRREKNEAVVLATLPAGAERDASVAHVRFNSDAQALASRIVRQADRRLVMLGVVHTHPGSLRHPSAGDLRGDGEWVACLRGSEGIFGIGTADGPDAETLFAYQPRPHVQCLGDLRFSWYSLRHGEYAYRPLPVELTIGPDLARPLHPLWPTLEAHAERIDRLYRQQARMRFEVMADEWGPGLLLTLPLAGGDALRVLVREKEVRYYVVQGSELLEVDHHDDLVDRGVYLLLAELAGGLLRRTGEAG